MKRVVNVLTLGLLVGFAGVGIGHTAENLIIPGVRVAYRVDTEPLALPVVTRHGSETHIVMDDGTLFVIPASGCVFIVRADETEGTCLG